MSNMAEVDDSTFHLTYMDGKEITFQVHEESIPSPRSSHMRRRGTQHIHSLEDDRLQRKNRVQISAEISNGERSEATPVGPPPTIAKFKLACFSVSSSEVRAFSKR